MIQEKQLQLIWHAFSANIHQLVGTRAVVEVNSKPDRNLELSRAEVVLDDGCALEFTMRGADKARDVAPDEDSDLLCEINSRAVEAGEDIGFTRELLLANDAHTLVATGVLGGEEFGPSVLYYREDDARQRRQTLLLSEYAGRLPRADRVNLYRLILSVLKPA